MTDGELKRLFDSLREENAAARQENVALHAETRRHFDVAVERLETRFETLAESVQHASSPFRTSTANAHSESPPPLENPTTAPHSG